MLIYRMDTPMINNNLVPGRYNGMMELNNGMMKLNNEMMG